VLLQISLLVLALLLVAMLVAAAYVWWRMSGAGHARTSFKRHCAFLAPHIDIVWPDPEKFGPGPYPLVIQLHGCGGVRAIMGEYARLAAAEGAAAAIVDSMTPRGIGYQDALDKVCTGRQLWGRERAADFYAALALLAENPKIDRERITAAGWSHGGWTILDALTLAHDGRLPDSLKDAPEEPLAELSAVMVFYPYNDFPARSRRCDWLPGVPVEALLVHGDTVATAEASEAVFQRQKAQGANIRWQVVSGVTHGFDEPDHAPHSTLRYDQEKTDLARGRYVDFLHRWLSLEPPAEEPRAADAS
jgi:dienelactone hydrolase